MIKINSVATQQTNAIVNVTFDLVDGKQKNMNFTVSATELSGMNKKQIKTHLKAQVNEERALTIQALVEDKFKDLIETDIEKDEVVPE